VLCVVQNITSGIDMGAFNTVRTRNDRQVLETKTAQTIVGDTAKNFDFDLRSHQFNGFLWIVIETLTKTGNGLDNMSFTYSPLIEDNAGNLVVPTNVSGLTLESGLDISTVGNVAIYDISRVVQDNGDHLECLSPDGVRITAQNVGGAAPGDNSNLELTLIGR